MQLFDTHCHLDDEQFAAERDAVVDRAGRAGVEAIVAVGVTAASSAACVQLAAQYQPVSAAVGIQPNHCAEAAPGDWDRIVALADLPEVVAIGETGLDRYWDYTPFDVQRDFFARHVRLAQVTGLPFIVHMRDCDADVLALFQEARRQGPLRGVMHSFTGSPETAAACLELGLHISFAGMVTYKKSHALREIAASVPPERLLIETDAPYLSPHPVRGQRPNEPALLVHTAVCLAELRGVPVEQLARETTSNALHLFRRGDLVS
jgi:TatD DNase family protein